MKISPKQIKLARIYLDWTQSELAGHAGVSKETVINIERENNLPQQATYQKIANVLYEAGIEFTDGNGIRERSTIRSYRGQEGFRAFMDDVYEMASTEGGEICLYNARPSNWIKWLGEDWYARHTKRMQEALKEKEFYFKVTAQKGDCNFIGGKHAEYRWVPDELFNQQSFYVYGDRLALLSFSEENVEIFVIRKRQFADSFRALFDIAWDTVTEEPDSGNYKPVVNDD